MYMRVLEVLFVALILVSAACLSFSRWWRAANLSTMALLAAVLFHVIFEGPHWQMAPAYAAVLVLLLAAGFRLRWRSWVLRAAAAFSVLLALSSVGLSWVLPIFHLPKPTGPYPVGTTTLYFTDPTRTDDAAPTPGTPREVAVQFWYPAEVTSYPLARYREPRESTLANSYQTVVRTNSRLHAPLARAGGPFALILVNPAWRGRRTNVTYLTEELASHGYIVASIDHPYSSRLVALPDGQVIASAEPEAVANPDGSGLTAEQVRTIWDKELRKSAADTRFVLDRLVEMDKARSTVWSGRINLNEIGAMGHSFGGAVSVEVCAEDPRVRAAINMDGWFFAAVRDRGPHQALLLLHGAGEGPPPEALQRTSVEAALDAVDFAEARASLAKYGGYSIGFDGVQHEDFTDQPLMSPLARVAQRGAIPAARMQQMVRAWVLAFLDQQVRGQPSPLLNPRAQPFPETELEVFPEPSAAPAAGAATAGAGNGTAVPRPVSR